MNELIKIEYKSQMVLTTQQLAEKYQCETIKITQNFNNNKYRYQEGVHFFKLEGQELKNFKNEIENFDVVGNRVNSVYLWTEKGCLLHAKSLGTDTAWQVYEMLVDTYFRAREEVLQIPQTLPEALRLAADLAEKIEKQAPLVTFAETVAKSKDSILIRELAKICCKHGIEIGEKRLYRQLREWGLIMSRSTEPYQEYVDRGYFEITEGTYENENGVFLHKTTRVLPRGQQYIINRLRGDRVAGARTQG